MVRFGSYLKAQRQEEWSQYYLDYEGLDDMIMALAEVENASMNIDVGKSGYGERVTSLSMMPNPSIQAKYKGKDITEADFFTSLENEMQKIDEFTHEQLMKIKEKIEALVDKASDADSGAVPMDSAERKKAMDEAKKLGDKFLKIEKFANLNFLGFHKILKKHDKQLPATPCRKFYLTRLHHQRWIRHDYSSVFVNLSKIYSLLRGDKQATGKKAGPVKIPSSNVKCSTQMFWVRVEDISKVKHIILQHLPVHFDNLETDSQLVNSVYFDNTQLELYHRRLDKSPGAVEVRFRWFASEEPEIVYVERRSFFDGWNSDVSVKDRFSLKPDQVMPFIRGEFKVEDKMKEMKADGATQDEMDATRSLFEELHGQLDSKQLEPRMRTAYNRVAYQIPSDESVRVCLDTGVVMHLENPREGPDCFSQNRWFRNTSDVIPSNEVTHFPHAVLEIKLSMKEGEESPIWLSDLVNSGLVTLVHKFSKYIHGCAALLADDVQVLPFWIDDETIQPSLVRTQVSGKKRLFANDGEGELNTSNGKVRFDPAIQTMGGIQIMKPRDSVMDSEARRASTQGGRSYGTMDKSKGTLPSVAIHAEEESILTWLSCGLIKSGPQHAKIPLKVEPKQFLANERTYLNWLQMAVTIGSIGVGLLGFTGSSQMAARNGTKSAHVIGMTLLPLAMCFCAYALMTFYWRGKRIRSREGAIHDQNGPLVLGFVNLLAMSMILFLDITQGSAPSP